MEADDLLCSRNAPGFVCLVDWSFWSVWFFRMNFRSDQPDRRNRPDRPDEPAFVGRAQWRITGNRPSERAQAGVSVTTMLDQFPYRTGGRDRVTISG